jgi:autotransporter-associated beta strand protein
VTFYNDAGVTPGGGGNLDLNYAGGVSSGCTYNLNGGTLTVPQIIASSLSGARTFNFNGGTLKAAGNNAGFMASGVASAANVRNGGAIIDDGGFDITISQQLLHTTIFGDNLTDGGLTKLGAGILVLGAANTFNGNTTVEGGTLELAQATLGTNSSVSISNGAVLRLDFTATNIVAGLVLNGVTQPPGIYNSTTASPYLSGPGSLLVPAASNPTNITFSFSSGTLTLSWPADHTGWRLQAQTNSLGTNWFDIFGSDATNAVNLPVDLNNGSVFYRLIYP